MLHRKFQHVSKVAEHLSFILCLVHFIDHESDSFLNNQ